MLTIHTSNQLEQLANIHSFVINSPLQEVFASEMVVVQNAGMARYLSMKVADASGISANTEYLFPAEFMWRLLRLVSPEIPEGSQCTPKTMRFHIMQELSTNFEDYPELHHYILNNGTLKANSTWELSNELSQVLDQYLFYRSDWIRQWENEPEKYAQQNWQARLWLRCVTDKQLMHWLALQDTFKEALQTLDTACLPERVSFFSMSSLSPGYIELLGEMGKKTDLHFYIMNPCEDIYWGDITSQKAFSKMPIEQQELSDIGNPLLSSMGTQGRDFIYQLLDLPAVEAPVNINKDQPATTLLKQCQNDIHTLQEPQPFKGFSAKTDRSITINSCHTAMREVEVLHDQILAALDADANLGPADIVVMMPDIEQYAPYINAIFSSKSFSSKHQSLPYSIADRDPLLVHSMVEALLKTLELREKRYDVESVFELLDYDVIKQHFKLDDAQLNQCKELAKATNIRWGINAKSRKQSDLPNTPEHTWKYALDNLLLGYMIGENPEGESLYNPDASETLLPPLPFTQLEGSNAIVLSNLKHFTDIIFSINDWHQNDYFLDDWIKKLKQLLSDLFAENNDTLKILVALDDLKNNAKLADFKETIPVSVFNKMVKDGLQGISGSEPYLGYGITFCAMVPMRSVPFKLVVLMGMNDGEYPRQDKRHSFDLMSSKKQRGDRSRRDEDRYLFLESILAARSQLIISFIGQSIKDNAELPPSVLVNELLETLSTYTQTSSDDLICKHPLQAYSPRYFDDSSQLFSYAKEYTELNTQNNAHNKIPSQVFIEERLPELEDKYKIISPSDLIQFFQNPARAFLKRRFTIQTFEDDITLPIREPFELESFSDRKIRQTIFEDTLNQEELIVRAKGLLPYGNIGDKVFEQHKEAIETFKKQLPNDDAKDSVYFDFQLDGFRLEGKINHLFETGRIIEQVTQPYTREHLELWINHLVLNSSFLSLNPSERQSHYYSPETSFTLKPVDNADAQLAQLLKYYWQGLHFPLQFFPKSAFDMFKDPSKMDTKKAVSTWNGSMFSTGESQRFENWLLHRTTVVSNNHLPEEFIEISEHIFGNLFANTVY